MWIVLENSRPACYPMSEFDCWHNFQFQTETEAREYASSWLGQEYGPFPEKVFSFDYAPGYTISIYEI